MDEVVEFSVKDDAKWPRNVESLEFSTGDSCVMSDGERESVDNLINRVPPAVIVCARARAAN